VAAATQCAREALGSSPRDSGRSASHRDDVVGTFRQRIALRGRSIVPCSLPATDDSALQTWRPRGLLRVVADRRLDGGVAQQARRDSVVVALRRRTRCRADRGRTRDVGRDEARLGGLRWSCAPRVATLVEYAVRASPFAVPSVPDPNGRDAIESFLRPLV